MIFCPFTLTKDFFKWFSAKFMGDVKCRGRPVVYETGDWLMLDRIRRNSEHVFGSGGLVITSSAVGVEWPNDSRLSPRVHFIWFLFFFLFFPLPLYFLRSGGPWGRECVGQSGVGWMPGLGDSSGGSVGPIGLLDYWLVSGWELNKMWLSFD